MYVRESLGNNFTSQAHSNLRKIITKTELKLPSVLKRIKKKHEKKQRIFKNGAFKIMSDDNDCDGIVCKEHFVGDTE